MSTYYLLSFTVISFLLFTSFISCSSLFPSINTLSFDENDQYIPLMNNNEENQRISAVTNRLFHRYQRSPIFYPRESRNTWFRVSTYQHFKPTATEEVPNGDNLLRWGR